MIEMMVVVTIVGLVAGVVFFPAATAFRDTTVDGEMRMLTQAQERARTVAIQYGRTSEFHIDGSSGRYWIEVGGSPGTDTVGIVYRVDGSALLVSSDSLLCYDARGFPALGTASSGGTCQGPTAEIVVSVSGVADTLSINSLGRAF